MTKEKKSKLYIVHCVDTEGPLHESIDATFERLKAIFDIDLLASKENLKKIQRQEIDFGENTESISKIFSEQLIAYHDTWDKIDIMLDKIMTKEYREQFQDSDGNGILYNWHCLDLVGFETNQRRRDIGFGNVFSHYKKKIEEHNAKDNIHWHFHPLSFDKDAHICNTSYDNSYELLHQIICRRLIDHNWFPTVNRAGFHAIRQDSSFFLEQWIPFDYSNQRMFKGEDGGQNDAHRFGDWRRAPKEWVPYHPSYDDYQSKGLMNRLTTKCLNIGTRFKLLDDFEIEMAFKNAKEYGTAILSFTNHDFRDMSIDIDNVYGRIHEVWAGFKDVDIINADAATAIQETVYDKEEIQSNAVKLSAEIKCDADTDRLIVHCEQGRVFGSQPYLAIKTKDGRYYHDNFNEVEHNKSWEYVFDASSIEVEAITKIGVATNDKYGNQFIISPEVLIAI